MVALSACWNFGFLAPAQAECSLKVTDEVPKNKMLFGSVEYDAVPQLDEFAQKMDEVGMPCVVKASLPRLLRVANDPKMRRKVWKRMKSEELYWVSAHDLAKVEAIAAACDMPLVH